MKKVTAATMYDIALIFAAKEGNTLLVKDFLKKGADPKVSNSHGNTALIMACQEPNIEIVELLIQNESNIHAVNVIGNTALIYASHNGRVEIVRRLIDAGAHVDTFNHQGNTPLIYAAYNGHLAIVQLLFENTKATIDQQDIDARSALMWATIRGKIDVVLYLLGKKANVNLSDSLGCTILDWARIMQRKELEQILTSQVQ